MLEDVDVLGISIKTFGVFFALNFAAWGALVARRLRELGQPVDWAYEIVFAAIAGGVIGARAYWLIQNGGDLSLGDALGGSGLVWFGGLLGGIVGVVLWARWRGFLGLELVDMAGWGLPLGYAIGRIGCQVSGDGDYGIPSGLPWAMGFPDGTVPTAPGVEVHPAPIYETLSMGLVAWVLWRLRDQVRPGVVFALYLVAAGTERLLVEFIRRNDEVLGPFTAAQLWSMLELVIGAVWLAVVVRRHGGLLRPEAERTPRPALAAAR